MIHDLKILKSFADAIISGDKTFEIRKKEREYQKDDKIKFYVLDDQTHESCYHPIMNKLYEITYILSGWGIKEDFVVFSIKEAADGNKES